MVRLGNRTYRPENKTNRVNVILYLEKLYLIRRLQIKSALRGGSRDLTGQIGLSGCYLVVPKVRLLISLLPQYVRRPILESNV